MYWPGGIVTAGNVPPGEIDDRVAARLARQSLFSRERPARFTYYLHEYALRLPVGGPVVLAQQLEHLLRMSARSYLWRTGAVPVRTALVLPSSTTEL